MRDGEVIDLPLSGCLSAQYRLTAYRMELEITCIMHNIGP